MKLENGHHITIADATDEQYHKFCKKVRDQGFDEGEHGCDDRRLWRHVGIWDNEIQHFDKAYSDKYPHNLLTIEQALSEEEETMAKCRIIEIEEKPKFKPFKLEVLIESEDDLVNLWHRMNLEVNDGVFDSYIDSRGLIKHMNDVNSDIDREIWDLLNEKAKELKLSRE